MTGKWRKLGEEWLRIIDEETQKFVQNRPILRLIYRLGCQARKVMSPKDVVIPKDIVIEVPAAQLTLEGHAPTVEVSPTTHQVGLSATARGEASLEARHIPAIVSDKKFQRILWILLGVSILLILIPVALTVLLSLPKEIEAILGILPNFGYAGFAVFLAAWLSRASAGPDS